MADESADQPLERRNGYVGRHEFESLRRSVEEFHAVLTGGTMFPGGGKLGQITAQITETQDDVRQLGDKLDRVPQMIAEQVALGIVNARRARAEAWLTDAWKIIAGALGIVIAAIILLKLGLHSP